MLRVAVEGRSLPSCTWVRVGQWGSQSAHVAASVASRYALGADGKVSYIRDIPGSASSPVLGSFAAKMNPALRTFAPTPTEAELVQRAKAR